MPRSFSSNVKHELSRVYGHARHCLVAEIAAMTCLGARSSDSAQISQEWVFKTENVTVARKYFTLLKKTFNIECSVSVRKTQGLGRSRIYILEISQSKDLERLKKGCRIFMTQDGSCGCDRLILRQDCCRRSFLRGAFLSSGSVSDPVRSYHFEIVCTGMEQAVLVQETIQSFQVPARVIQRKGHCVVYVKDASQVVDLLGVMGAHKALLEMENVRIVKEMRGRVNRSVNCEMANLNRTANAAARQIADIRFLMESRAFYLLDPPLRELAELRLQYPEASLAELGQMLDVPVGKSGVNHRLGKISETARRIREKQGDIPGVLSGPASGEAGTE